MAKQKPLSKDQSTTTSAAADAVEERLVAFAAQLGTLVGTVQAKTDGWLDREALGKQLTAIRDRASELLDEVTPKALSGAAAKPKRASTRATKSRAQAAPASLSDRGLVHAPGKQHRKPPPQTKVGKHASAPKARVIGNPNLKTGRRGARG